jgi:hypothetical protein
LTGAGAGGSSSAAGLARTRRRQATPLMQRGAEIGPGGVRRAESRCGSPAGERRREHGGPQAVVRAARRSRRPTDNDRLPRLPRDRTAPGSATVTCVRLASVLTWTVARGWPKRTQSASSCRRSGECAFPDRPSHSPTRQESGPRLGRGPVPDNGEGCALRTAPECRNVRIHLTPRMCGASCVCVRTTPAHTLDYVLIQPERKGNLSQETPCCPQRRQTRSTRQLSPSGSLGRQPPRCLSARRAGRAQNPCQSSP